MKASTSLAGLDPGHKLYGGPVKLGRLVELAQADFAADGIDGDIAIAGGALDGVERVLQTQLRPGDRVAVEDPCWPRITDLVRALGLQPEPVRADQRGPVPDELARALARGARAAIVTPRGQNPTGAAVDAERGRLLRDVPDQHPSDAPHSSASWPAMASPPMGAAGWASGSRSQKWPPYSSYSNGAGRQSRRALRFPHRAWHPRYHGHPGAT
jgi:hypothetical protein